MSGAGLGAAPEPPEEPPAKEDEEEEISPYQAIMRAVERDEAIDLKSLAKRKRPRR